MLEIRVQLPTVLRMPFDFDAAIAVRPLGDGVYDTPIRNGWDIMGNANGGYLLALVAEAMKAESGRLIPSPSPRTIYRQDLLVMPPRLCKL